MKCIENPTQVQDYYDSSSDDECFLNHLKTHHTRKNNADKWKTCTILINGISIVAEPDSGSDTNIIDESQFANLHKQAPELKIKATKIKLETLKKELPVPSRQSDVETTLKIPMESTLKCRRHFDIHVST